jgi:hypothetical protein
MRKGKTGFTHRTAPIRIVRGLIISQWYAAGHTMHQNHFHPLRQPVLEIAVPNVIVTNFANTFHIQGTAPRPAISIKIPSNYGVTDTGFDSLPQLARQGEKSELDDGDTTHPRRLISRRSKERRDNQVYCSGKTMYDGGTLANDIANPTAQFDNYCSGLPPGNVPTYVYVNNIQVYVCTQDELGRVCISPGYVAGIIAQVQAACGPNIGGWFTPAAGDDSTYGLDPAGQEEC